MIDVYVHNRKTGILSREGRDFVFTYDELQLLSILAPSINGRLTFVPWEDLRAQVLEGEFSPWQLSLDTVLHTREDLFETLVRHFLFHSAIGGIQPKVLAPLQEKFSVSFQDFIVKTGGETFPRLPENEYFCLTAAKRAGLAVPDFYLSDNKKLLVIKSFNQPLANEHPPGFEELAVLLGKTNRHKYEGSYEQAANAVRTFVAPAYQQEELEQFFKMLILSVMLRNGDAHLKNFGILYHHGRTDSRIAPAYDIVTTTCYLPHDVPALMLDGKKVWWSKKKLLSFGERYCLLSKTWALQAWDHCANAVETTRTDLLKHVQKEKDFKDFGLAMYHQ